MLLGLFFIALATLSCSEKNVKKETKVNPKDTYVAFNVELPKDETRVKSQMLDINNQAIAGTYYVYINKILINNEQTTHHLLYHSLRFL